MCFHQPFAIGVDSFPKRFFPRRQLLKLAKDDATLQKAVREYCAVLSFGHLANTEQVRRLDIWKMCGRLAAEFLKEDGLAVYSPVMQRLVPATPDFFWTLSEQVPFPVMSEGASQGVTLVDSDDSGMLSAIREARSRWPEFVAEFERRAPSLAGDTRCFVKIPFEVEDSCECMWIQVTALEGEFVWGVLDNEPTMGVDAQIGEKIRRPASEILDWMITFPDGLRGGFSLDAVQQAHRRNTEPPEDA